MIRFSVIIPHKNTPDLLQRCLNSIPIRDDVQIIVVDDNSDADKVDFEHFPGIDDERVEVYLTKEGKGAGYARNVGMSHAKGDWLIFADADDYFYTDNLSQLMDMDIPEEFNVVVWKSKYVYLDGRFELVQEEDMGSSDILCRKYDTVEKMYLKYVPPWTKMVRKKICCDKTINFEEVRYSNDEIFSTMVGINIRSYLYVNILVYCHERRDGSLVEKVTLENCLCRLYVYFRKNKILKQYGTKIDYHLAHIRVYNISYCSFLRTFFKELKILGWRYALQDYLEICRLLDISYIPFFRKISVRRLKHHFSVKNSRE